MAYCGKIWHQTLQKQIIAFAAYILIILGLAFFEKDPAVWLNASDAIIGVGLGAVLFTLILKSRMNINLALALLLIFEVGYCFFRNWMYAPTLAAVSQQMAPMYETYLKRIPALRPDKEAIAWIQLFMLNYQAAIIGSLQIAGTFLGLLLFNMASAFKLPIRLIKFPYATVYVLIAALGLTLYPVTRMWGINLLVCMSMIYLIQGVAILSYAWGDFFQKAKLLRTFLIMAIILNYPILVLIALTGVLDVWFDFRKLTLVEEKHESDIN